MELLAPAGNFECLTAAVQNGADAVYFSGKTFGARSYANNFDCMELEKALDYCHLRNCKAYITVNTLVFDKEFEELSNYLLFLSKAGADAVIVQDLGVVALILEKYPELPIHASTQMSVHNSAGVKALEEHNIKRVVLARELSKNDIAEIADTTNTELEIFAHGAMCMSYSGQCLMSSMLGGRSGNRGKCAQPCRLPYRITGSREEKFYLSLKDMSLLNHLAELQNIGITSLKLEGRMKGAAYVAAVVQTYRRCLDSGTPPSDDDLRLLNSVFFRGGYSDGYLTAQTGRKMFAFDKPDNPYQREDNENTKKLLKTFVNTENVFRKLEGRLVVTSGQFPIIHWKCDNFTISHIGSEVVQMAQQRPLTPETVQMQMRKTGGTIFEIEKLIVELSPDCFLSTKALNELRRNSLQQLQKQIIASYKRDKHKENLCSDITFSKTQENFVKEQAEYHCSVLTLEQYHAVKQFAFTHIGVPISLAMQHHTELIQEKERIILIPPAILRESEWKKCQNELDTLWKRGFRSIYVHNISMLNTKLPYQKYGSFRLNVTNYRSAEFFLQNGCTNVTLSPELTLSQTRDIALAYPTESIIYGHLPLMITENCIIRNIKNCVCENDRNYLIDRLGISFPIVKDNDICRSVVLNAKPIYMADKQIDLQRNNILKRHLMFTIENISECMLICSDYFNEKNETSIIDYTRAHFYKGVSK